MKRRYLKGTLHTDTTGEGTSLVLVLRHKNYNAHLTLNPFDDAWLFTGRCGPGAGLTQALTDSMLLLLTRLHSPTCSNLELLTAAR